MSDEKVLTKEIAAQFLAYNNSVDLSEFTEIKDAAAESLSKHKGRLNLGRLKTLSDAGAKSLSKHKGGELVLGYGAPLSGLSELSDAAAKSLGKYKGHLNLSGLRNLSDAAAMGLSKHKYIPPPRKPFSALGCLFLYNLQSFKASEGHIALCERMIEQPFIQFFKIKSLSNEAAEIFGRYKGALHITHGPLSLSDKKAQSLAKKRPKFGPFGTDRKGGSIALISLPASAAQILRDAGHGV